MKAQLPFFGNLDDDLHCFQASLRMALKHFEPSVNFSWDELDVITGWRPGFYTWPTRAFLWLRRRGYEIKSIESIDSQRLVREGRPYFVEYLGEEVAHDQFAHCDFEQEMDLLRQYLAEVEVPELREPTLDDVRAYLGDGFVTMANVNSVKLNERDGYVGHFVVLLGADHRRVHMHDPGLPHAPHRSVKLPIFEAAWAYPDKNAKGLTGVRRRT